MRIYWLWLAALPDLNERDKRALLAHFRDPEDLYRARSKDYMGMEGVTQRMLAALEDKELERAEEILEECEKKNIRVICYGDEDYPVRLQNIPDPPVVLYCRGTLPAMEDRPVIAVVGTRKASAYGMETARSMGYQIGACGGIVVSGMAEGVDGLAMEGALTAGSPVVGVLGCGVDVVYPPRNRALYREMERRGCLLSEFPPGTMPYKWNFPKRNRVLSGMSDGVLVVEAPEKSGALITARMAFEQSRDVFVVPGNIGVASGAGSNALLRDGAFAVSSGWDVVSEYAHLYPGKLRKDPGAAPVERVAQHPEVPVQKREQKNDKKDIDKDRASDYIDSAGLTKPEQTLLQLLGDGTWQSDDLLAASGLPAGQALAALTMLRVKGLISALPGGRFERKNHQ